jgi:hypothetical protein
METARRLRHSCRTSRSRPAAERRRAISKQKHEHRSRADRRQRAVLVRRPGCRTWPPPGGFSRPPDRHGGACAADTRAPPGRAGRGGRGLRRHRAATGPAPLHDLANALTRYTCEASISTCRCELRIETIKPASTSTSAIMVSRKKVEVPAWRTSKNSISMTMNSAIANT